MKLCKLSFGILLSLPLNCLAAITENDITGIWEAPYNESYLFKIVKSGSSFAVEEYSDNPEYEENYELCKYNATFDTKSVSLKVDLNSINPNFSIISPRIA